MSSLNACKQIKRKTRSSTAWAKAGKFAAEIIGVGLSNLIEHNFMRGAVHDVKLEDDQSNMVKRLTMDFVDDFQAHKTNEEMAVMAYSPSAARHMKAVDDELEKSNLGYRMPAMLTEEIIAAAAMINVIRNECKQGRLATIELAELTGRSILADINPNNTLVESLDVERGTIYANSDNEFMLPAIMLKLCHSIDG